MAMERTDTESTSSATKGSTGNGYASTSDWRCKTTDRQSKRTKQTRRYLRRPLFPAQSIDPSKDRGIIADTVDFVVAASRGGFVSLILKFAEHRKYTLGLEEKVNFLIGELKASQKLATPRNSRRSVQISLDSETTRLTKADVPSVIDLNANTPVDCVNELVLPGMIPHPPGTTNDLQTSLKSLPLVKVAGFQDSLPEISAVEESSCIQKNFADTETQTVCAYLRTSIERACSPIKQDLFYENTKLQEQLKSAKDMVQNLLNNQQFTSTKKEKECRRIETQTDFESISSKPKLVDKSTQCEEKSKISPKTFDERSNCKLMESSQDDMVHNRQRSSSLLTNAESTKSYPGVQSKRDKCHCSTCVQVKKSCLPRRKSSQVNPNMEWLRIGVRVGVKNHGTGTVKYIGRIKGAKKGLQVGVHLDRPVGRNNGSWDKTRYFECPSNYGVFVPIEELEPAAKRKETK